MGNAENKFRSGACNVVAPLPHITRATVRIGEHLIMNWLIEQWYNGNYLIAMLATFTLGLVVIYAAL